MSASGIKIIGHCSPSRALNAGSRVESLRNINRLQNMRLAEYHTNELDINLHSDKLRFDRQCITEEVGYWEERGGGGQVGDRNSGGFEGGERADTLHYKLSRALYLF